MLFNFLNLILINFAYTLDCVLVYLKRQSKNSIKKNSIAVDSLYMHKKQKARNLLNLFVELLFVVAWRTLKYMYQVLILNGNILLRIILNDCHTIYMCLS